VPTGVQCDLTASASAAVKQGDAAPGAQDGGGDDMEWEDADGAEWEDA
jgi:hypothetical protein